MAHPTTLPTTPPLRPSRKRFQDFSNAHLPALLLDAEASIRHLTEPARRLLEHAPSAAVEPCFFSHVHGRNLRQVMQDIADMVRYGKQQASWLLRMRTGQGRWRWYKVRVANKLSDPLAAIVVHLRGLYDW